jgi:hypothetical protein
MTIEYLPNYEPVNKPYICKVFKSSNGEENHTAINISNESEKSELTVEIVYAHLDNVLKYIQDRSKTLSIIQYDEQVNEEPWAIKGWTDIEWAVNETSLWWNYIYYKERPMSNTIYISYGDDGQVINLDGLSPEEIEAIMLQYGAQTVANEENHTHEAEVEEETPNA